MTIGVLLSGGVDSSTALFQLRESNPDADIHAYYLKIWLEDELSFLGQCPWEEDLFHAREVCRLASVPLSIVSLQKEYWDKVVSYTIDELKTGRTPSPDIFCNQRIKFGFFLENVGESLDKIATGHYASLSVDDKGITWLHRSPDKIKDQSYFLSHLSQTQVSRAMFPIGSLCKNEVRRLAEKWNLPNKYRKDSQGICFLGKINYTEFIRYYMGEREGNIVETVSGRILGTHRGTWFYTIGQREGLGLSGGPWYVTGKEDGDIHVAHASRIETFAVSRIVAVDPNWISGEPDLPAQLEVKLRHGPHLVSANVRKNDESGELEIFLDEPDKGIAPGQFVIFYDSDICLGGAMIARRLFD